MSPYLVIRLPGFPDQPVHWQRWPLKEPGYPGAEAPEPVSNDQGSLSSVAELSTLAERFPGCKVLALVPTELVSMHRLTLPGRLNKAVLQSLPYRLEDELAEDVDRLHFAVLGKEGDDTRIAVVSEEKMAFWRDSLQASGLNCRQWIPEALALPWADGEHSVLNIEEQWLVRSDRWQWQACDPQWLPLYLDSLKQEEDPVAVTSFSPATADCTGEWHFEDAGSPLEVLAPAAITEKANLLQGKWQTESSSSKKLKPWRLSAGLLALTLAVFTASSILKTSLIEQEAQQIQAQSLDIYNQLFPGERVVRLESQIQQKLQAINSSTDMDSGMLYLLDQLAPVFRQHSGLKPVSLSYNQSQQLLRLEAMAGGFDTFTAVREQSGPGLSISVESLTMNGEQANGTLIITHGGRSTDS